MTGSKTVPQLSPRFEQALVPEWRWRTAHEGMLAPSDMATTHLFHTLRMIWNNHMPPERRVGVVKLYAFTAFYTPEYMAQAIEQIGSELFRRDDLPDHMRLELELMAAYYRNRLPAEGAKTVPQLLTHLEDQS